MKNSSLILFAVITSIGINAQEISINQLGYFTNQVKLATVPAEYDGGFEIINDATGEAVYSGMLSNAKSWNSAGTSYRVADFSDLTPAGTYHLRITDTDVISYSFRIGSDIYTELSRDAMRFFYLSRVSMPLLEEFAGEYARQAGHPDTAVRIHASAASAERPEGSTISTPRGWYDAGDYNKYMTNAGISNYTVFSIAEHYPDYSDNLNLNIPESSNNVPDIIDEGIYNLRWMLSMQDPNDGGVYHKCTHLNFLGFITPAQAGAYPRYVVMKTTAAALNLAAVSAQAYRILQDYEAEYPGLADSCLAAAVSAFEWAEAHPTVYYQQPSDVSTGGYGDGNVSDEFKWAATELYIATQNMDYLNNYNILSGNAYAPSWGGVYPLGLISLIRNAETVSDAVDLETVANKITVYADGFYEEYVNSAYRIPSVSFGWGSNSNIANGAMMSLQAFFITGEEKYRESAIAAMDYLLGRNPTGYSFVTGYGSQSPMHPHDRKSSSDGVEEPIPAMLVGGPNAGNTYDCGAGAYPSTYPALSYIDNECSYSTNEITINWNAPLAYLSVAIQSLQNPQIIQSFTGTIDSTKVYVEFDTELDAASINTGDFMITANEGIEKTIATASVHDNNTLLLELESYISAMDSNLLFSYVPGVLKSINGSKVDTIMNRPVTNLVYGSAPIITAAFSDTYNPSVYLEFSKKMTDPHDFITDFELLASGELVTISSITLTNADSTGITISTASRMDYMDTILIAYNGFNYAAKDGGILKTFDSLTVKNNFSTPAELSYLSLAPGGDKLDLGFSKALIDTSLHVEDFVLSRNQGDTLMISSASLDETGLIITLELVNAVEMSDTNLQISYIGNRLLSEPGIPVEKLGPVEITNVVAVPLPVPGHIEAEDYFVNNGYVLEDCADEGGGYNFGYADPGDYADFYVDVAESGLYTIIYRLASNTDESEFEVFMPLGNPIDTIAMASTGDWQNWTSIYSLAELEAGPQLLRIATNSSAFNLNWIAFESGNTIPLPIEGIVAEHTSALNLYPNPAVRGNTLRLMLNAQDECSLQVELIELTGRKLATLYSGQVMAGNSIIETRAISTGMNPGVYILAIKQGEYLTYYLLELE